MKYFLIVFVIFVSCRSFDRDDIKVDERRVDETISTLNEDYLKSRDTVIALKIHEEKKYILILPIEFISDFVSNVDEKYIKSLYSYTINRSVPDENNLIIIHHNKYNFQLLDHEKLFLSGKYMIYDNINKRYVDKVKVHLYSYYANVPLYGGYTFVVYVDGHIFYSIQVNV